MFADDVKIFTKINNVRDCVRLQQDLISLNHWCENNKLDLNVKKFNVISYSRRTDVTL